MDTPVVQPFSLDRNQPEGVSPTPTPSSEVGHFRLTQTGHFRLTLTEPARLLAHGSLRSFRTKLKNPERNGRKGAASGLTPDPKVGHFNCQE